VDLGVRDCGGAGVSVVPTLSNMRNGSERPRVLVLNQYYWPGVEATAHLLSELCEALADEFDMTVVTGMVAGAGAAGRSSRAGVEIVRVGSTAYDRSRLSLRALNYLTYLGLSLWEGLKVERPDVVLCMTDPPVIADLALVLARRFDAPLVVVSQDVFPEVAVALKRLDNPAVVEVLRLATRLYLKRAERVVAIGDTMRERLEGKGAEHERIVVIPNWVDTSDLEPRPRDNAWAREHGLADKFVVMHSGNIGHAQDLDTLR
jgi:glycosyltransferase involved in cell wall biosynthesis